MNNQYFVAVEGVYQYVYLVSGIENFKLYRDFLLALGFESLGYSVNFSDRACFVFSRRVN